MAVADVYDALISKRVYKPPFPHEKAVEIIREGHGKHFDPDMTDAFLEITERFRQIAEAFTDSDDDPKLKPVAQP
jgi:putative two-component system response regulator